MWGPILENEKLGIMTMTSWLKYDHKTKKW